MEYIEKLFSKEEIEKRTTELAKQIDNDYENEIIMVCVLKGAMQFYVKLIENMNSEVVEDLIKVKSYVGKERGKLLTEIDSRIDVYNRDVIIVEDIVDSGYTLQFISDYFKNKGAKSVKTCTLLDKKVCRIVNFNADYVGFEVPDVFVVGCGMDYSEYYRNLDFVGYIPNDKIDDFVKSFEEKNYVRELKK